MKVIRSAKSMQRTARQLAAEGARIGLVPTMGFLHEGHLSLLRKAKRHADVIVTTIFVNPTQFTPSEDLATYPRDTKGDLAKIRAEGGDFVFMPGAEDMYPGGFQTWVTVGELTHVLEGASRPTHFRGVTTVVAKLYNIIRPDMVVFGQKDFQQAVVLRRMTADLGYAVKFLVGPTVREPDGLALSSRNRYFSEKQRPEAAALYRSLLTARQQFRSGERSAARVKKEMTAAIRATCPTAEIDYVAFTEFDTLRPVRALEPGIIVSLAVTVHGVRLIDNMKL
jgi:pantoate--beta-alanine ligase